MTFKVTKAFEIMSERAATLTSKDDSDAEMLGATVAEHAVAAP